MNLTLFDWGIIGFFYVGLLAVGLNTRRFMKGVSDFLVAGRGMRKYLGYAAGGAADVGAISIVAGLETNYVGGPAMLFFGISGLMWGVFIGKTGFVINRIRETKIMTMPQLFEIRYSKGVRILAGILCAFSGILNMGIFPIVAGRFFTYFGGLPQTFPLFGMVLPTIPILTAFLIAAAISFAFMGGQISVIVTDFIQAITMSFMFIALGYCVYRAVTWESVSTAILNSKDVEVLLNPFTTGGRFGLKWFILGLVTAPFSMAAWATGMNKVISASSPKQARLTMLFKNLRLLSWAGVAFAGFAVYAAMNLPQYAHLGLAESVGKLDPNIQDQMAAPLFLARILPVGVMGLMFAGMMSAFISTNDSYMLTWASVIVQDVIYPLRKKPLPRKQHILLLRITVICVGIVIYLFGLWYKPTEAIIVFQVLTGVIYMAGAGVMITLGLYWRRGNKYGAYAALITGALIPILNHILVNVEAVNHLFERIFHIKYNVDGLISGTAAYVAASAVYVIVSLLTKNPRFNLEKMLNRPPRESKK